HQGKQPRRRWISVAVVDALMDAVAGLHCQDFNRCAGRVKWASVPRMRSETPSTASGGLLRGMIKLTIALAIAEAVVRYGMSRPIFGRRLEQYGKRGWLISQMAQYDQGGGWLHHRFPLEPNPNLGWTNTPGKMMDRGNPMTINADRLRSARE